MTLPNNIPEAVALIVATAKEAAVDLTGEEGTVAFAGLQMRKNAATSELPRLKAEFPTIVEANAGALFVIGSEDAVKAFVEVAVEEGPAVTVDAREMYRVLAEVMSAGVKGDALFSQDTVRAFLEGLRMVFGPLGVSSIPAPDFKPYMGRKVPTLEDLADIAQKLLESVKADADLNAIYLTYRASEAAVEVEWPTQVLPVLVLNATKEEAGDTLFAALFDGRNVVVEAKDNLEPNDIVIAFNKLKNRLKNRNRK